MQALQSQIYINREWTKVHSAPDSIDWSNSTADNAGKIITVGNTLISGQHADILVTKFDGLGMIEWQATWNGNKSNSDYGADVICDAANNVYVVGTARESSDSLFDIVLLKYSSGGSLQWAKSFDGAGQNDFPVKMTMDEVDGIYIAGGSEDSSGVLDYITLKYDTAGTFEWSVRYDYNGNVDIAADVVVDSAGTSITVTGGSEDSAAVWDYTTVSYDGDGDQQSVDRQSSDETDIEKPKDLVRDEDGNFYITGVNHNGADYDIKLIKLDSGLNPVWVKVVDDDEEGSNALAIDDSANLYVGGWQSLLGGPKKFLIVKYDSVGTLKWQRTLWPDTDMHIAEVTGLTVENNFYLNVIGFTSNGFNSDMVTAQYTLNGSLLWYRTFENTGGALDVPSGIEQIGDDIYVSGRTSDSSGLKWVTMKYSFFERDTSLVYDSTGKPLFAAHELIVRFDQNLVNAAAVDNANGKEAEFGDMYYWLDSALVDTIHDKLSDLCIEAGVEDCEITMLRIFDGIKTSDTVSQSRLGKPIRNPPFWATFVVTFPDSIVLPQAAKSLDGFFPQVIYAHPNIIATVLASPNDFLYSQQACLHSTNSILNAHINVEQAWGFTTGEPFIKVGVFDSGILYNHEDFTTALQAGVTKIVDGWNFASGGAGTPLFSTLWGDQYGHGTEMAGIIGAIRNNLNGIAGIAGGNDSIWIGPSAQGVALYGIRIFDIQPYSVALDYIADAVVSTAKYDTTHKYGYGLHIANHSWGFDDSWYWTQWYPIYNDSNLTLLREAFHYANRKNVIQVAGRGNENGKDTPFWPAVIDDDWIIAVGGTDSSGNFGSGPSTGWEIDVAAPADTHLIWTTAHTWGYKKSAGTSAATAIVSGVAGLLTSYLNDSTNANSHPSNLAPEDVEYLLEMTATDCDTISYPGKDSLTGYGRVNAGKALKAVDKTNRKLLHFDTDSIACFKSISLLSTNDTIIIPERYQNQSFQWFKDGKYVVNTFKVQARTAHNLAANDFIIASWPRHSASNSLPIFDTENYLLPRERVVLDTITADSAILTGYIYEVRDTVGNYLGWWPFDTSLAADTADFAYSILVHDSIIVALNSLLPEGIMAQLYPNPTIDVQELGIWVNRPIQIQISLLDLYGRKLAELYDGNLLPGEKKFPVPLSSFSPGTYFFNIKSDAGRFVLKTVKL